MTGKNLDDFLVTENFVVQNILDEETEDLAVKSGIHSTSRTPFYEVHSKRTLVVKPDNESVPTRILRFVGPTAVREGDYISAKILKDQNYGIKNTSGQENSYEGTHLKDVETAIELTYLTNDGRPFYGDKATNYSQSIPLTKRV